MSSMSISKAITPATPQSTAPATCDPAPKHSNGWSMAPLIVAAATFVGTGVGAIAGSWAGSASRGAALGALGGTAAGFAIVGVSELISNARN